MRRSSVIMVTLLAILLGATASRATDTPVAPDPRAVELMQKLAAGQTLSADELAELEALSAVDSTQVQLVLLPATVVNRRGRPVTDLTVGDFRIREDRVEQQIRYFSVAAREPLSVAFLLDLSGSMRQAGKLDAAKQAILHFVEALRPTDQFALVGFADDQVSWITDFTSDHEAFSRRLSVQRGFGQTALYDAVAATPSLIDDKIDGRRAIVLITDGFDNASEMNLFSATRLARKVNVPIYTIGFSHMPARLLDRGELPQNLKVLRLFADQTGGQIHVVRSPSDLKEAAAEIDRELRAQYLIGYYPQASASELAYRRIHLETTRGGLTVRTRQGYYATPR